MPPRFGNDGDLSTDFTSVENDADVPWWQIDLGSARRLTAVQLVLSRTDDDKKYRTEMQFQASNDPEFRSSDVIAWTMEGTEIPLHGDFYAFLVNRRPIATSASAAPRSPITSSGGSRGCSSRKSACSVPRGRPPIVGQPTRARA